MNLRQIDMPLSQEPAVWGWKLQKPLQGKAFP